MKEPRKPVMSPEFWHRLADSRPTGLPVSPEVVQSWFDIQWPAYCAKGYTQHIRAIASWWSRVGVDEIERAQQRLARIRDEAENRQLELQQEALNRGSATVTDIRDYLAEARARNRR